MEPYWITCFAPPKGQVAGSIPARGAIEIKGLEPQHLLNLAANFLWAPPWGPPNSKQELYNLTNDRISLVAPYMLVIYYYNRYIFLGNFMIEQWVHLSETTGSYWAVRVTGAARKTGTNIPENVIELSHFIRIKLGILTLINNRIIECRKELIGEISPHLPDCIFRRKDDNDNAYPVNINNAVKYQLISDIEALIMQLQSCWQIIKRFTLLMLKLSGQKFPNKQIDSKLKKITEPHKQSLSWIDELKEHRQFVTHLGGIYLAFDVSEKSKRNWDLLILKNNLHEFDDPSQYIRYSEIDSIIDEFIETISILHDHLINQF